MIQRRKRGSKVAITSKPDDKLIKPIEQLYNSIVSPSEDKSLEETSLVETSSVETPLLDRVNDIAQKEKAMSASGVTRRKVYDHISKLLSAEIETRVYNKESLEWVVSSVPDMEKRTKGAELALKAFGDLKEMSKVDVGVVHNKVVYQWLSSPNMKLVTHEG